MIKILPALFLIAFVSCSPDEQVLLHDYSFLGIDGEVKKLHQSSDTLFELKCYIDRPCQPRPDKKYKILSWNTSGKFAVLKLEHLDTILLSANPYPETRYLVLALKRASDNQLGYLPLASGLTRQQLDTIRTHASSLEEKFFFTFFSENYLKELASLKKVKTTEDALRILEITKSDHFETFFEQYRETATKDLYASGFAAEIFNRACIEAGYNPIGAGRALDTLLKQQ